MNEVEALLRVRPVPGGHHPPYGTHNALLSLGLGVYLEIITRDPALPAPGRGALVEISPGGDSRLITWALRVEHIRESAAAADDADMRLGRIESGSRTRTDGSEIAWQSTDPYAMPMSGAIPLLISWGNTAHPSAAVPVGGRLVELVIEHPEADRVRRALSSLGAEVPVVDSDAFGLCAKIETRNGVVALR